MATVKVANPKNFALTQGKEYEVLARDGRKITIVNDKNVQAAYFCSVFENEGAEPKKAAPKKPALPTANQVLDTFVYNMNANRIEFVVLGANFSIDIILGNSGTDVSCGIRQIFDINNFYDTLTEFFEEELPHIPVELRNTIIDGMFRKSVETVMHNVADTVGMFIVSTNENTDYFPRVDSQLQPLTVASHSRVNPNSGNPIKLWILNQQ